MFRTTRDGQRYLTALDVLIVGLITIVAPALVGGLALWLLGGLANLAGPFDLLSKVLALLGSQISAPIVTIFAVPCGLLVGVWALRFGWAGWAIAILLPAGIIATGMFAYAQSDTGYAPGEYFEPAQIFIFSGAFHGLIMWLAIRWRRPEAIKPR